MGGYRYANNLSILNELNIGRIIVCGTDLETLFPSEITYLKFDLEDEDDQHISNFFDEAHEFINNSQNNVLVHCYAGVSRSATIVMSYLIKYNNMTVQEAKAFVKKKRPCICPNNGFISQLVEFEQNVKPVALD